MRYYIGGYVGSAIVYVLQVFVSTLLSVLALINNINNRSSFRPTSIVLLAFCVVGAAGGSAHMANQSDDPWYQTDPWLSGDPALREPLGQGVVAQVQQDGWLEAVDYNAPAVKNDPRAGTGRRLPDNEVQRTVGAAANSKFLEDMCRALDDRSLEALKILKNTSHRGMIECPTTYARKFKNVRKHQGTTGILLFLDKDTIAGPSSKPTAEERLAELDKTIFFDLGNQHYRIAFLIMRAHGSHRLSVKDKKRID